jgi:aminobutyraldehyde dehydrogenase
MSQRIRGGNDHSLPLANPDADRRRASRPARKPRSTILDPEDRRHHDPEAAGGLADAQIDAAVAAAEKAFSLGRARRRAERSGYLLKIAERIEAEADARSELEALNCGKPINAVVNDEIPAIVDCYRFFAGAVPHMPGSPPANTCRLHLDDPPRPDRRRRFDRAVELPADDDGVEARAGHRRRQHRRVQAVRADAADGPEAREALAEICPKGVVNVVLGRGESVGNALINHPKVNMISITGDVATGKKVLQAAAKSVKRTHLELGGKAPVIVFDDADIEAVVAGLRAFGYYNAGQDCTAACRIYAGRPHLRPARRRPLGASRRSASAMSRRHDQRDRAADLASASATASRASSSAPAN